MDPVAGLLLLLGVLYAARAAGRAVSHSTSGRVADARQRTAGSAHHRRAARQARVSWWAGEAAHGFPVTRSGFAEGWADHRHYMAERNHAASQRRLNHTRQQTRWRDEMADHRAAMNDMAARERERRERQGGRQEPSIAELRDKLADGKTPGSPEIGHFDPALHGSDSHQSERDSKLTDNQNGSKPVADGTSNGSGEGTYDETLATAARARDAAEHVASEVDIDSITSNVDALGAMIPDDQTTQGLAGDLATAALKVKDDLAAMQEAGQALYTRVESTYGPVKEAKEASGESLPQPEFVES